MAKIIHNWKRFWCPIGTDYFVDDDGFLIDPEAKYGEHFQPKVVSFGALSDVRCLALLGEPGMGKSTALNAAEELARIHAHSSSRKVLKIDLKEYSSEDRIIRDLFESDLYKNCQRGTGELDVFIDSLDEGLLRVSSVANLLAAQFRLGKPPTDRLRLRIACRTAEWPLESLGSPLREIWGNENVGAYQLMPLTESDVVLAASATTQRPMEFMSAVRDRRVGPLAAKPVTLEFLLQTFSTQGDLPKTQSEVYSAGCSQLVSEPSPSRKESNLVRRLDPAERLAIAARIGAVTILCGKPIIWTGSMAGCPASDVSLFELTRAFDEDANGVAVRVDEAALQEVLGTPLFESAGDNRRAWAHRTYAEFLASEYLIRHRVKLAQLKGLLITGPNAESRVYPQLEEVAGWFASVNPEFRKLVVANDPHVLLRSDVATSDDVGKKAVVDGILVALEQGRLARIPSGMTDRLKRLAHPTLGEQLKPYMQDRSKDAMAREAAIDIAEACRIASVEDALVDLALDPTESLRLREQAVSAVAKIGSKDARKKLLPLTDPNAGDDPEHELKGIALSALWPELMSASELFARLTLPTKDHGHHSYYQFVRHRVIAHLKDSDLTEAMAWVEKQPSTHQLPFAWRDLVIDICAKGWDGLSQPELLPSVAKAIWSRLDHHDAVARRLPDDKHEALWEASSAMRLPLVAEMVPLIADSSDKPLRLVHGSSPIVFVDDIPWLLERLQEAASDAIARVWVELVYQAFPAWEPKFVDEILAATALSPLLKSSFSDRFDPIVIDSERARKLQAEVREHRKWAERDRTKPLLNPPPKELLIKRLDYCEATEPKAWAWAVRVMQLQPDSTTWDHDFESDLTELPGWKEADEATRARIITGAKKYLEAQSPNADDWFGTNQYTVDGIAGYKALRLLKTEAPGIYDSLDVAIWRKWAPIVVGCPGLSIHSGSIVDVEILERSYSLNPDEIIRLELLAIDREELTGPPHLLHERLKFAWDQRLKQALLEKVKESGIHPKIFGPLLENLVKHDVDEAIDFARSIIAVPVPKSDPDRSRVMKAAELLARFAPAQGWNAMWPAIQDDAEFGRALVHSLLRSHEVEETSFADHLTEDQLAQLFSWLADQYPPKDDPADDHDEYNSVPAVMRRFRNNVIGALQNKATPNAIKLLQQLVREKPGIEWLKWVLIRAMDKGRQRSWVPPLPSDLLKLVSDSSKRIVDTGEQLLAVIKESLARLELKLQGKGMVEFLWNESKDVWRPKEEDAFSRYVANHLIDDLKLAGVVINREVEIRQGEYTDIHVTAMPKGNNAEPSQHIKVIIEVKGSWHAKVKTAMRTQLLETYLKGGPCNHGLYLVGWFNCKRWNMKNPKKNPPDWTLDHARTEFSSQAKALSEESPAVIDSVVLDTALRD